jgi:alpha-ketoglutarate-dependent taurine dioxygenase
MVMSEERSLMFNPIKRKVLKLSAESLVETSYLEPEQKLPLVVQPGVNNLNLIGWAESNREFIETELLKHGAILFRGFGLRSTDDFSRFAQTISSKLIEYGERSSPRTLIQTGVYTSTDHPADQSILLHTEQSYTLNWPMKIMFFCLQPPQQGGRTPIANTRKIFGRLQSKIVEKFEQSQIMYVRNYGDGLGLGWQEVFQTSSRANVEALCRATDIQFEWKSNERLRTWQVRPAIRRHPRTDELVWFNHGLFFHFSSLEPSVRETMLEVVAVEDVPFTTFYGDGTPIEAEVLQEIREAYEQEKVSFPWQQFDLLLLDNMLTAHGREPFIGPRKIVASMTDPFRPHDAV